MTSSKAFIFDLNGTMIDDMEFHTQAWYRVLNEELGANLSWEEIKKEMYGKNEELLVRMFGPNRFSDDEVKRLSMEKEKGYQQAFAPHLQLIAGLESFLAQAKEKGKKIAIGSAAILFNVDFVLDNLSIRQYFDAIVSAEDVAESKPHPETFLKAAKSLGITPQDCIVFEDAPKGVEAAANAGMKSVVLTTMHNQDDFAGYNNTIAFIKDYTDPVLHTL